MEEKEEEEEVEGGEVEGAWLCRCGVAVSTIGSRSLLLAAAAQVRGHQ